jgi:hypothetical protein
MLSYKGKSVDVRIRMSGCLIWQIYTKPNLESNTDGLVSDVSFSHVPAVNGMSLPEGFIRRKGIETVRVNQQTELLQNFQDWT